MNAIKKPDILLGIDIGTSSVKCSIVQIFGSDSSATKRNSYKILSSSKCSYNRSRIQLATQPGFSQQNVREILACLDSVLTNLQNAEKVQRIAFSCQMHGIVLWNDERFLNGIFSQKIDSYEKCLNFEAISDLYDWTDSRSTPEFMESLPVPDSYADVPSSGYGCVTLFWLQRFQPEVLDKFNASSTIGDFIAMLFCCSFSSDSKIFPKPFISTHNAHSWAYFDPLTNSWNEELLENNSFPVDFLPEILVPGSVVGTSTNDIFTSVPNGKPVHVCIGDLQAIISCALNEIPDASYILNMGTSAQLCRIVESTGEHSLFIPPTKSKNPSSAVDFDPFQKDSFIVKAASLNGGNVLQNYVNFLKEIVQEITGIEIESKDVFSRLDSLLDTPTSPSEIGSKVSENKGSLELSPTLFGERHQPTSGLTLKVRHRFPNLRQLTTKLGEELIDNLVQMMATSFAESSQSPELANERIVCTGSVTVNESFMKKVLRRRFPGAAFVAECDADVGAALFAAERC